MINELKNSVSRVLYERLTSPLAGTFFLSWFIWNWKIPYFLIFSDKSMTLIDRLQYVESNYFSANRLFFNPVLCTVLILVIYPIPSLGSYFLWAKFKFWKNKIKNYIEKNVLLSEEDSIRLILKNEEIAKGFAETISNKDKEIEVLKMKLDKYVLIPINSSSASGEIFHPL
ncbi:MAG: hypothetical protein L6428_03255 [Candidatus Aminicenantes bacterium]|nr:hypothetical protein [Acidobacteriota bacterium]MCG2810462.1 hypothetical protein [Candidatus Aminicenantes bacterium]